ncbi:hypothetical protein M0812_02912 [Anaeramoeba flamelloides]|uniref:Dystroglycan-type cadherin-like domain-containing protein n=1 Tax=Anaeramoeba flamelloides TaxID=1746091 RepID=A0AAV7YS00_9EUKA|nr:hypothetical protein M0812_02912 [Anaeramoeba flamelloides]
MVFFFFQIIQIETKENPKFQCPFLPYGDEYQVNNYTLKYQRKPSLTKIRDDKYVIAWESLGQDGSAYGIYAQYFSVQGNGKIGKEFRVNNVTNDWQEEVDIATIGANQEKFVMCWDSVGQDGDSTGIIAQIYNSTDGEKIGKEFIVNSVTESSQSQPKITPIGSKQDKFVICWQGYNTDNDSSYNLYAQIFNSTTGSKLGSEFLVNDFIDGRQFLHSISAIGANREKFVVSWSSWSQDGDEYGIFAQIFDSNDYGKKIGNEFQVNSNTTNSQYQNTVHSIGKNRDRFAIAWESDGQDGDYYGIFAQMYNSTDGEKIGKEFQANTFTQNHQRNPTMCSIYNSIKDVDQFVIIWESEGQEGINYGIFGQIFDITNDTSGSKKFGAEFQVNTATDNDQIRSAISPISDQNNRFVITWESKLHEDFYREGNDGALKSNLEDEDVEGVFAQNYKISEKPIINKPIQKIHSFNKDNSFNFQFDADTFFDPNKINPDNNVDLVYDAKLSNGNDLPNGLSFEPDNRKISGSVSIDDSCQNWEIKLIALEQCQILETSQVIYVSNSNPEVNIPFGTQIFKTGSAIDFQFNTDTFYDRQDVYNLEYEAKMQSTNTKWPEWLSFDQNKRLFSTTDNEVLPEDAIGDHEITLTAIDSCNNKVDYNFILSVIQGDHNHVGMSNSYILQNQFSVLIIILLIFCYLFLN